MKVYGPYLRKDNRKHVVIIYDDGSRKTKSYPRYLLESYLGRELLETETIDHINNDFTDNRVENLQILSRQENAKKEMEQHPAKWHEFICPCCGNKAKKRLSQVVHNWKLNKQGPYCSRTCAGKMHN